MRQDLQRTMKSATWDGWRGSFFQHQIGFVSFYVHRLSQEGGGDDDNKEQQRWWWSRLWWSNDRVDCKNVQENVRREIWIYDPNGGSHVIDFEKQTKMFVTCDD